MRRHRAALSRRAAATQADASKALQDERHKEAEGALLHPAYQRGPAQLQAEIPGVRVHLPTPDGPW